LVPEDITIFFCQSRNFTWVRQVCDRNHQITNCPLLFLSNEIQMAEAGAGLCAMYFHCCAGGMAYQIILKIKYCLL
jgi:hypothetical protein